LPKKIILVTTTFRDHLPDYRNHYLAEAKKLNITAWCAVSDPDELYCEELARDLKSLCEWAEQNNYNMLGVNCHEQFEYFEWLDELDRLEKAPESIRESNFYKTLIFKLSPNLMYHGIGVTKNVHETWYAPDVPWRRINLDRKYYYTHKKSPLQIWRNAARNLFMSGGGNNVGEANKAWVELRRICDRLGIFCWRDFEEYMKKGKVDESLKKWLIDALQVPPTNYGIETRETAKWYFLLHPDEITPEIERRIKNPPKLTEEQEIEFYVVEQYIKILGRHADEEGKRHYTQAILSGQIKREDLPKILMSSPEYLKKIANKPIEAWVTKCYLEILRRQPDEAGLKTYVEHIETGRIRKEDLPRILRESEEYKLRFGA